MARVLPATTRPQTLALFYIVRQVPTVFIFAPPRSGGAIKAEVKRSTNDPAEECQYGMRSSV